MKIPLMVISIVSKFILRWAISSFCSLVSSITNSGKLPLLSKIILFVQSIIANTASYNRPLFIERFSGFLHTFELWSRLSPGWMGYRVCCSKWVIYKKETFCICNFFFSLSLSFVLFFGTTRVLSINFFLFSFIIQSIWIPSCWIFHIWI